MKEQNKIFSREDINLYLQSEAFEGGNNPNLQNEASSENVTISLSRAIDFSGHGTAVAGIAASNGSSSKVYFEAAASATSAGYEKYINKDCSCRFPLLGIGFLRRRFEYQLN